VIDPPEAESNSTESDHAIVVEAIDFLLSLDGVTADMRRKLERLKIRVETFPNR
jgi:hypothetical protein